MPLAQEARHPTFHLKPADGAIGAHQRAVADATRDLRELAERVAERCALPIPARTSQLRDRNRERRKAGLGTRREGKAPGRSPGRHGVDDVHAAVSPDSKPSANTSSSAS